MLNPKVVAAASVVALALTPQVAAAQTPSEPSTPSTTTAPTTPPPATAEPPPSAPASSATDMVLAPPIPADQHPRRRPWFVHVNVGVPVYTTVGSWTNPLGSKVASQSFNPGDRFALVELVGAGYWVHPNIRLNLSLQFAEMLTSQPANSAQPSGPQTLTGLTFMSAIAWAAFTYGPLFAGVGPMSGPRWMGNTAHNWVYGDFGVFSCLGAAVPLGSGLALSLAVQAPVTFNPAVNFTVVPALSLSRRF